MSRKARIARAGVGFDLVATAGGQRWYVEVAGGFVLAKPGMLDSDDVWRLLGKATVLSAVDPEARLLVLTPRFPRRRGEADKALRAVGPGRLFDVVELFADDTPDRLMHYAAGATEPLPGFWPAKLF